MQWETSSEAGAVAQVGEDGGLEQGGDCGGSEKGSDFHVLQYGQSLLKDLR